ncbi:hypothetical protein K492DRAFT_188637 [Lichtheimia hyalospora FSU 10163]|nr:hypothetical protein K492DRAFT_188637 [Lichtheimia hyalospora FSU 10163]
MTLFSSSADLSTTGVVVNTAEQEDWEALFNPHSALLDYSPATARFHYQQRQQQRHIAKVQVTTTSSSDDYEEEKDEIVTPPLPRAENMVVEPNANNPPHLNGIDILPCPSSSFFYPPQEQDPYRIQLMQDIEEQGLVDHNDQYHNKAVKEIQIQQHEQHFHEQYQQQQKKKYDSEDATADTMNDNDDNNEKGYEPKYQRWLPVLQPKRQQRPRRVFLYFILGFIFPPMWIVGAVHVPHQPTSAAVDLLWKRRCRNAFFIFSVIALFVVIILLVFQPGSIGWRHSPTGPTIVDDSMIAV